MRIIHSRVMILGKQKCKNPESSCKVMRRYCLRIYATFIHRVTRLCNKLHIMCLSSISPRIAAHLARSSSCWHCCTSWEVTSYQELHSMQLCRATYGINSIHTHACISALNNRKWVTHCTAILATSCISHLVHSIRKVLIANRFYSLIV